MAGCLWRVALKEDRSRNLPVGRALSMPSCPPCMGRGLGGAGGVPEDGGWHMGWCVYGPTGGLTGHTRQRRGLLLGLCSPAHLTPVHAHPKWPRGEEGPGTSVRGYMLRSCLQALLPGLLLCPLQAQTLLGAGRGRLGAGTADHWARVLGWPCSQGSQSDTCRPRPVAWGSKDGT